MSEQEDSLMAKSKNIILAGFGMGGLTKTEEAQREVIASDESQQSVLRSFIVFKCGHNFHIKCLMAKAKVLAEQKEQKRKNASTLHYTGVEKVARE